MLENCVGTSQVTKARSLHSDDGWFVGAERVLTNFFEVAARVDYGNEGSEDCTNFSSRRGYSET